MPNHVFNSLNVSGDDKVLKRFIKMAAETESGEKEDFATGKMEKYSAHRHISFNKFIPMPKELDITSDGMVNYLSNPFSGKTPIEQIVDSIKKADAKTVKNFVQAILNLNKYGHCSWYEWNVAHWGTKWNAYDINEPEIVKGSATYHFNTAWSPPIPVVKRMAEIFPALRFELVYEEESDFYGKLVCQDGAVIEDTSGEYTGAYACKDCGYEGGKFHQDGKCPQCGSTSTPLTYDEWEKGQSGKTEENKPKKEKTK